jgi:putative oxygen-independent coproporphyrinogen III oxidase
MRSATGRAPSIASSAPASPAEIAAVRPAVVQPEADPLALYVHWPFCVSKCPYCDFNSHVRAAIDEEAHAQALLRELAHEAEALGRRRLGSIFFGGGTPSLMSPGTVERVIAAAVGYWTPAGDLEVTLEANPTSVEASRFQALAEAGVNRVSLGMQSFDDAALRFLGRPHDAAQGLRALEAAQRAFARVSFDLIYARPGQTGEAWAAELERALGFGTGHLSLYELTIEPGTRFAAMVARGELQPMDDDRAADLFELTQNMTASAGLPAYEVSNHARAGEQSRHNLAYWTYADYAGVGAGAHGRRAGMATRRVRKPENWLAAVSAQGHGIEEEVPLAAAARAREALLMGLRLRDGIDAERFAARSGVPLDDALDATALERLVALRLVSRDQRRLAVTPEGRLLTNSIIAALAR